MGKPEGKELDALQVQPASISASVKVVLFSTPLSFLPENPTI